MAEEAKKEAKKEPTKPYRYKGPGKHHLQGLDGTTETTAVKEGDIVQLTARQAKAFQDRFEEVNEK